MSRCLRFDHELIAQLASLGDVAHVVSPCHGHTRWASAESRTLICTDLVINVTDEPSWLTRMLYLSIGVWRKLGPATVWRRRTTDIQSAWSSYKRVLDAGFDRVLMAHGDPIEEAGAARVREALRWASEGA